MSFSELFAGFKENPLIALVVLGLIAIGWLIRDAFSTRSSHADKVEALYRAHVDAMQRANDAHLQTAMQVAPLASKLVDCVAILDRLATVAAQRGGA